MTPLWTSSEAAAATGGETHGNWSATGVSIDTRTLAAGDLFVALQAERDGHDFVAQALGQGAAAALVTRIPQDVSSDAPLLVVEDTLAGLTALGGAARDRSRAQVVAVTGSVGKTGAKEMLRTALGVLGPTHAAEKSYNNHWGVPLTLARLPRDAAFAVIEIGMNAPGEIAPLARLARPHVALITTVAAVHLEAFGSVEGIAREKASIAEGLEPGGVLVLNRDTDTFDVQRTAAGDVKIVSFGQADAAEYRLGSVNMTENATTAEAYHDGTPLLYKLAQPGRHLAANALGVLAVIDLLGGDVPRAALALAGWSAPEGRGERWEVVLGAAGIDGTIQLIDESFNASPAAMAAAFDVFALTSPKDGIGRINQGRRIAMLGDMLELGPSSADLHAGLANIPALEAVDLVHCAGPMMRALYEALPVRKRGQWCDSTAELAPMIPRLIDAGDVVMCKGSKGSKVGILVEAIKRLGEPRPYVGQGAE